MVRSPDSIRLTTATRRMGYRCREIALHTDDKPSFKEQGALMTSSHKIRYSYFRSVALKTYVHLLIVAIIGVAAYSNTFRVPFEFDDFDMIQNNLMIRSLDNFVLALQGHDFGSTAYQYNPSRFVGFFSFALNYYFGETDVTGYHLANLFIHVINAFLVYFFVVLTLRTTYFPHSRTAEDTKRNVAGGMGVDNQASTFDPARFIGLFSALLFVSHPVQTQAVTYIVQRFASLATLFYLLSVVLYIKGRLAAAGKTKSSGAPLSRRLLPVAYYVLSLVSAIAAMRTKEIAYTLPAVIILYEFIFFPAPIKRKLFILLPVVLILIIIPIGVFLSDKPFGEILSRAEVTLRADTNMPRGDYLMTEMRVIVTYIRLLFLPINLNLDYDYPIYNSFSEPPVFFSVLFLSAVFGTAVYLAIRARRLASGHTSATAAEKPEVAIPPAFTVLCLRLIAFGIFWFFITLSVESSIIPIKDVIAEHRIYLPSVGFLAALVTALYMAAARFDKRQLTALVLASMVLALSVAAFARNNVWKDRVSLWEDVAQKSPNRARSHAGLGAVYFKLGRFDEAMRESQTAVSLDLSNFVAHYNMGLIYLQQDRLAEAKMEFQSAVWLRPDRVDFHNKLGIVYERQGLRHDAIKEYQAALKLDPYNLEARRKLEGLDQNARDDLDR
jgi:tetratricopeptide (TPR) repeat protein